MHGVAHIKVHCKRLLTNVQDPRANDNFCDEPVKPTKPPVIQDYDRHVGYADNFCRIANHYCQIQHQRQEWSSDVCGTKITHRDYRYTSHRS
jgi:hypothetical protein